MQWVGRIHTVIPIYRYLHIPTYVYLYTGGRSEDKQQCFLSVTVVLSYYMKFDYEPKLTYDFLLRLIFEPNIAHSGYLAKNLSAFRRFIFNCLINCAADRDEHERVNLSHLRISFAAFDFGKCLEKTIAGNVYRLSPRVVFNFVKNVLHDVRTKTHGAETRRKPQRSAFLVRTRNALPQRVARHYNASQHELNVVQIRTPTV